MNTPMPTRHIPEDVRRPIARALASYYSELAGADEEPEEAPFSLRRTIEQMTQAHGLRDGHERDICSAMAKAAGEGFDPNRVLIPLRALARRDLTVGSASGGGFLVGTGVSEPMDVLRPWSVVVSAGVVTMPGLAESYTIPRVSSASTAGWMAAEGSTMTTGQPGIGQAVLTPKMAAVTVNVSRQWRLQADGGERFLSVQLLRAVGQLVDGAFFGGTGAAGQPLGLHNTPGIGTQGGGSLAHAGLLAMRKAVLNAGGIESNLRWVGTPTVQEALGARERTTGGGRMLWDDGAILGNPANATSTAPAATLTCGDFSQAVFGIFGPPALRLEINPYQDFRAGIVAARVMLACDVAFPQPAAFSVASSIT